VHALTQQLTTALHFTHVPHTYRNRIFPIHKLVFNALRSLSQTPTPSNFAFSRFAYLINLQASLNISFQLLCDRSSTHQLSYFWHALSEADKASYTGRTAYGTQRTQGHCRGLMDQYKFREHITQRITAAHNSTFYRHVIRTAEPGSFFFTPIILIANADAIHFEKLLIKSMHNLALNDTCPYPNRIPTLISTQKLNTRKNSKRKTKQRKHSRTNRTLRIAQGLTPPGTNATFTPLKPQLFRVHKQRFFYHRLSSLLHDNLHTVISVHFYPGRPHTHKHHTYNTFGPTLVMFCGRVYTLWEVLHLLLSPHFVGRVSMLPVRRHTRTQQLLVKLGKPLQYPINTIVRIAPHFTALDWLSFFRNTHKFAERKMAMTARRHIKTFMFNTYHITTKQLVAGLQTNIVLHHHPNTNTHFVRTCQQLILSAHAREHPQFSSLLPQHSFLTVKRNKTVGELLFNYRSITDSFDPTKPPPCLTPKLCKHGHYLKLPYELDRNTAALCRNVNAPALLSGPDNIADITTALTDLLQRLRLFLPPLTDNIALSYISQPDYDMTCFFFKDSLLSLHNSQINHALHFFMQHKSLSDPYIFLSLIHAAHTSLPSLKTQKPDTGFLTLLRNVFPHIHILFSHPLHMHKRNTSFTAYLPQKPSLSEDFTALGSLGTPWSFTWDTECCLAVPPLELARDTLVWANLSLNTQPYLHNTHIFIILPLSFQCSYPTLTRAAYGFSNLAQSPAPNYHCPFQLIILSRHKNPHILSTLLNTWRHSFLFTTLNTTTTTTLAGKPCSAILCNRALKLVWPASTSLCLASTTFHQNLTPPHLYNSRLPLHTFLLSLHLKTNITHTTDREEILTSFSNIIKHNAPTQQTYNHSHTLK